MWAGKVKLNKEREIHVLMESLNVSRSVIYKSIQALEVLGWVKRDEKNRWLFIRGFDRIRFERGWEIQKAGLLKRGDLMPIERLKAWCVGAFTSSYSKWRNRCKKTGLQRESPLPAFYPVSLTILKKELNVSEKTAFNYRNLMVEYNYAAMMPHHHVVKGLTFNELIQARSNGIENLNLKILGFEGVKNIEVRRLKMLRGDIVVQNPNLIKSHVLIRSRRKKPK